MNKRRLFLLITVFISLSACTIPSPQAETERFSVVATVFAPYDFARAVAGGRADVAMLLPPSAESHSFEPTPRDIDAIENCDVFIYIGGTSDTWVDSILESINTDTVRIISLMDCVEVLEEEIVEGMEDEKESGGEPEYDEHVWTSPRNAKLIVQKITDVICQVDAEGAEEYRENASAYQDDLDKLDAEFQAVVNGGARKTIVFGDRFPFRYLAEAYGLEYYAAFPGCAAETEPSAATLAFLVDKVKAMQIPVVFHLEQSGQKMAETISRETGAEIRVLHAAHNVTKDELESGVTYLDLMRQNAENLREALSWWH